MVCNRIIGKTRNHYAIGAGPVTEDRIICVRHINDTQGMHTRFFPGCPHSWHDLHDHESLSGTRAGMRWAIDTAHEIPHRIGETA